MQFFVTVHWLFWENNTHRVKRSIFGLIVSILSLEDRRRFFCCLVEESSPTEE
jgi:hypothetical protein